MRRPVVVAAVVAVAAIAGAGIAMMLRSNGDAAPPARSEALAATVSGVVIPGATPGTRVVVDADGRGWQIVGDEVRARIGNRLTVRGNVLPSSPTAPDVVRLAVSDVRGATQVANARPLKVLGRSGVVEIEGPTGLQGDLRVDGETVAGGRLTDGSARWNTRRARNGVHLLTVAAGDRLAAYGWAGVTNRGGSDALPGRIAWTGDFEPGNLSQWDLRQAVSHERARVVSAPVRQGRMAARFEVRQGEDPISSSGPRAELTRRTNEQEGDERWYAWSLLFDPDFPTEEGWQVVTQWHADAEGVPPLAIYAQNGRLELQVNRHDGPGLPLSTEVPWSGPLKRGQWRDLRLHVIWSGDDATGLVHLFVDGVEVLAPTRLRTLYPGIGSYLKQGYYRDPQITEPGCGVPGCDENEHCQRRGARASWMTWNF